MRHPPFDTPAAREELRCSLNEMEGVDIPANQLRYWPRFPLSVLQQPANLARLVAVLDRLATESHTARPILGPGTAMTRSLDAERSVIKILSTTTPPARPTLGPSPEGSPLLPEVT